VWLGLVDVYVLIVGGVWVIELVIDLVVVFVFVGVVNDRVLVFGMVVFGEVGLVGEL